MSWTNRVVWQEGMFLRTQHFQQQDRWTEQLVRGRVQALRPHPWGMIEYALDRDLPLIKARWAKLNPPPTRDIPVLIGGGGERKTLRIVAEQADIWHGFGRPDAIAHKHAVLDEWCRKVGRDPAEIERSSGVSPTPGRLPEDVGDYAAGAQALHDVGTRLFTVGLGGPDYDLGPVRDLVAWRDAHGR